VISYRINYFKESKKNCDAIASGRVVNRDILSFKEKRDANCSEGKIHESIKNEL